MTSTLSFHVSQQSVWAIGGHGISPLLKQFMKPLLKPDTPSSLSGTFQGKLNPLTGKAIFEACVVPVLLYGCENRVLSDTNLTTLEAFQGGIGRRILRLSTSHSLLSTRVALQLQSVSLHILSRQLSLLHRVSTESDSLGHRVYSELFLN